MNNYHQNGIDYPEVIPQPKIPEDLTPLEKAKRTTRLTPKEFIVNNLKNL